MNRISIWLTAISAVVVTSIAGAHHSAVVFYDLETEIVHQDATVLEWRYTNPHAQLVFETAGADSEPVQWIASTGNVNSLRRLGYTRETFEPGQIVTVSGNPARDGTFTMEAHQVDIRGGDVVNFSVDESLISLDTNAAVAASSLTSASEDGDPGGLAGIWRFVYGPISDELKALAAPGAQFVDGYGQADELAVGDSGDFPLTATARDIQANWNPASSVCRPPSVWIGTIAPYLIEISEQRADRIHIRYEYMDQERTIWLDGRGHPSTDLVPRSLQGHSTGHWEGDTLVVETTNMVANIVTRNGIYHSENAVVTERFRRDGDNLIIARVLEDPDHFTRPIAEIMSKQRVPGGELITYGECVP